MRINVYENVGQYSKNIDIEYDSANKRDCTEVDKYISRLIPGIELAGDGDTEEIGLEPPEP